jgi:hypothetical protein
LLTCPTGSGRWGFNSTTDARPVEIVSIVDEQTRRCLGGLVDPLHHHR